jgi:MFS family permease
VSPISIYFILALTLFSFTSVRAGQVLLALYALHLGAQPFAVGILAATFSAFPMLLSWQVGKLADRFGSRWPLFFAAVGGASGMLVPYYVSALPALYIAAAMNGLLFAYFGVSLQNLVGLLSHPQNRARNFSNFSLLVSLAGFLGPLLSGFSIDHAGHAVACLYLVLIALVPAAMIALWGGLLPRGSRTAPVIRSIRDLLASSGLWRVLITSGLLVAGIALPTLFLLSWPLFSP